MARVRQFCADAKMSGSFGVDRVRQTGRGGLTHFEVAVGAPEDTSL